MSRFRCKGISEIGGYLKRKIEEEWFVFRLTMYSLFYNSLTSWSTVADTLMEPLFWFVDHFVRYLGPVSIQAINILGANLFLDCISYSSVELWSHICCISGYCLQDNN